MTRPDYAEKCILMAAIMRECAAEDPALSAFMEMFDLLEEPVFEEAA